jgi:hypothetical protein
VGKISSPCLLFGIEEIYKIIVFATSSVECKTWFQTIRAEHGLKESENSVLARIFERKVGIVNAYSDSVHPFDCRHVDV